MSEGTKEPIIFKETEFEMHKSFKDFKKIN